MLNYRGPDGSYEIYFEAGDICSEKTWVYFSSSVYGLKVINFEEIKLAMPFASGEPWKVQPMINVTAIDGKPIEGIINFYFLFFIFYANQYQ